MDDGLAEWAIRRVIIGGRFVLRGRLRCAGLDKTIKRLRLVVNMRLSGIGLKREGECGEQHD